MTICINLMQSATLMATMYLAIDNCVWTYLINTCNNWVYSVNCTSKTQRYKRTEFIIRQSSINRLTPPHDCTCPNPDHRFPTSFVQ